MGVKISELPSGSAEQLAVVPVTNAAATETRKVTLLGIASLATKQTVGLGNVDNTSDANKPVSTAVQSALDLKANVSDLETSIESVINTSLVAGSNVEIDYNTEDNTLSIATATTPTFGSVELSNGSSVAPGTYDNNTGGGGGVSLNCVVGYELNWQGGRLKSTYGGSEGEQTANIFVDSPMSAPPVVSDLSSINNVISTDAGNADIFDITLDQNSTLANPTNPVNGKTIRWRIRQDATGNRTVTLGNKFNIPSSATSPLPFSTAANKMDVLAATYHAGRDKWDVVAFVMGY